MSNNKRRRKKKKGTAAVVAALLAVLCAVLCIAVFLMYQWEKENERPEEKQEEIKPEEQEEEKTEPQEEVLTEEEKLQNRINEIISGMTLEEKAAQLFMITPEALTGMDPVTAAGETTRKALEEYPVGGIIYFKKNLVNPEQVRTMTANIQTYAMERTGLPLLLSVDEEGGSVTRFGNNPGFDFDASADMKAIGESGDPQQAYELGERLGSFLYDLGINMDNAPDADVLSNPQNTVVRDRSFGSDCEVVSEMALAELRGLESQGVIGMLKHFPGHGATAGDTHEGYAYTDASLEEMKANELVPFADGIEAGVDVIMVGHISCPQVTGDDLPASLSEKMTTQILRQEMGYDGFLITDAMNMGAVSENYSSSEAAVAAIRAGIDMILMPQDFQQAYEGILNAVESGELTEERIDESLRRITALKLKISGESVN